MMRDHVGLPPVAFDVVASSTTSRRPVIELFQKAFDVILRDLTLTSETFLTSNSFNLPELRKDPVIGAAP